MDITFQERYLQKRYPLHISRGVITGGTNLFVQVREGDLVGLGEMAPGSLTGAATTIIGQDQLVDLIKTDLSALSVQAVWARAIEMQVAPCAMAALDIALWDLLAKHAKMPLVRLLGLSPQAVPTSVTIGINTPEVVTERVPELLNRTKCQFLKIKLGSPEGIDADQAMYESVLKAAKPFNVGLRVDANGGWSVEQARLMMRWLAERDCEYVEQPLHYDNDDGLPHIFTDRPLPVYVDESCRFSSDIKNWHQCVDGINVKLMKCGGITEALRLVATARAFGLKTMIGCMGESSISISAGASLGGLFDTIDLDSHLNLDPDPAEGAALINGIVTPLNKPGHGGNLRDHS